MDLLNAIREDLGNNLGTYSDAEIEKALSKLQVGWAVDSGSYADVDRIRLSSGQVSSQKFHIVEGKFYG